MKKFVLSVLGLVSLSGAMFAGTESVLNVQVPFAFAAGGKLFPAGSYKIVEVAETGLVTILGGSTENSMALITLPGELSGVKADRGVKFERKGSTVFLTEVVLDGRQTRIVREKPVADLEAGK